MTDEYEFDTIDEAFDMLYEFPTNGPEYCIVQGGIYDNLRQSTYVSAQDAMEVTRHLNKGEIEEAEELTGELLEPPEEEN